MKTENFDDAIRRKVESINHQFTEKDIERVHNYVNANKGPLWLRGPFRRLLVYSFTGLVLTGIITWQLTKIHDREILKQTVETLKKDFDKTKVATSITKEPQNQLSDETQNNPAIEDEKHKSGEDNFTKNNHKPSVPGTMFPQTAIHKWPVKTRTTKLKKEINPEGNPYPKNTGVNKVQTNMVPGQERGKKVDQPTIGNQSSKQKDGQMSVPENTAENTNNLNIRQNNDQIHLHDNLTENTETKTNPEKQDSSVINEQKPIAKHKKADSLRSIATYRGPKYGKKESNLVNIRFQAGISAGANNYFGGNNFNFGGGVIGEVILNNHFSLSAGFNRKINTDTFKDNFDLHNQCGKDFDDMIHSGDHHSDMYQTNITIRDTLFQIPIAFAYYFPLKNHFAISIAVGTNLDVYSHQTINYEQRSILVGPPPKPQQVDNTASAISFNNGNLSLGIIKQWRHFALQVNPYISTQFVSLDYKLHNNDYGVNLKLLWCFGKVGF